MALSRYFKIARKRKENESFFSLWLQQSILKVYPHPPIYTKTSSFQFQVY